MLIMSVYEIKYYDDRKQKHQSVTIDYECRSYDLRFVAEGTGYGADFEQAYLDMLDSIDNAINALRYLKKSVSDHKRTLKETSEKTNRFEFSEDTKTGDLLITT